MKNISKFESFNESDDYNKLLQKHAKVESIGNKIRISDGEDTVDIIKNDGYYEINQLTSNGSRVKIIMTDRMAAELANLITSSAK